MGDLLEALREYVYLDGTRESLEKVLDWKVLDLIVNTSLKDETVMAVILEKGLVLEVRYFLSEGLRLMHDDCEIRLRLNTNITSRVAYNVFYSGYIHGQGYIRISLASVDNKMIERILEDFYTPKLKSIYKPIIIEFKGFFSRDFFGINASNNGASIYYSTIRSQKEEIQSEILDVVSKLYHLEGIVQSEDVKHKLAELDLQMSFLPSVMWM